MIPEQLLSGPKRLRRDDRFPGIQFQDPVHKDNLHAFVSPPRLYSSFPCFRRTSSISSTLVIACMSSAVRTMSKSVSRPAISPRTPRESHEGISPRGFSGVMSSGDSSNTVAIHANASSCFIRHFLKETYFLPGSLSGVTPIDHQVGSGDPTILRRQQEDRCARHILGLPRPQRMTLFDILPLLRRKHRKGLLGHVGPYQPRRKDIHPDVP